MGRSKDKATKPNVQQLLEQLAAAEQQFLRQEFIAPVLRGGRVAVRMAGVVCDIQTQPAEFVGWGIFQPVSHTEAHLTRSATLAERQQYLDLFPPLSLVVCRQAERGCQCSTASYGDGRFQVEGLVSVELVEGVQQFDVIRARHDGSRFWFDRIDARHSPASAAYLRSAIAERLPPQELSRPGLTAEERAAYELNYWMLAREISPEPTHVHRAQQTQRGKTRRPASLIPANPVEERLRASLSHAGAQLVNYLEHADSYRVTYTVGGRRHTSAVSKADLTVQVAGICLSGEDRKFDLSSLVGVLNEGGGGVVHVGDEYGIDEDYYWRVHPPRQ
jgi:hypothetical protein